MVKHEYEKPAVRVRMLDPERNFLATGKFSNGDIDDATEEEWTY